MADSDGKDQLAKAYQWQKEFLDLKKSYGIEDYNTAYMYYTLSNRLKENVEDNNLRKFFAYAICDDGFLKDCYTLRDESEIKLSCNETEKRIKKFSKLIHEERFLYLQWEAIINKAAYPLNNADYSDEYDEELIAICHLFRETFEISENQSPELARNLQYILMETRSNDELGLITPLYLFQIMIRHTKRLAQNPDFEAALSSLWKYKEYGIEKNNGKNFYQYEKYILLFQKLCKHFKNDSRVSISQCRYGMERCSNLPVWAAMWLSKKEKKCITKLHRFVNDLYLSCIEVDEPKEYSVGSFIVHKESEEDKLFEYDIDSNLVVSLTIKNYILEHAELLVQFMKYHYNNLEKVKMIVTDIYLGSGVEKIAPGSVSEGTKMTYVYEQLIEMLDDAIKESVWQAVDAIVKNVTI